MSQSNAAVVIPFPSAPAAETLEGKVKVYLAAKRAAELAKATMDELGPEIAALMQAEDRKGVPRSTTSGPSTGCPSREAGEAPRHRADEFTALVKDLGEDAWTGTYGEAKGAFARRQTLATLALASAVITARTDRAASDVEATAGLLDVIASWTREMAGAWASWMDEALDA